MCLLPCRAFAEEGDVIVNVDAAKVAPFHFKFKGNDALDKQGSLPDGYSANLWDADSSSEVWLDEAPVEGSKAIGLANTAGKTALQLYNWRPYEMPGGRTYTVTAEYLTKGTGAGKLFIEGAPDVALNIESTGGQWKTLKTTFAQHDAAKITTKAQVFSMGLDNAVYLKTLKIVDSGSLLPDRLTQAVAYNDPAIRYVGRWLDRGDAMNKLKILSLGRSLVIGIIFCWGIIVGSLGHSSRRITKGLPQNKRRQREPWRFSRANARGFPKFFST